MFSFHVLQKKRGPFTLNISTIRILLIKVHVEIRINVLTIQFQKKNQQKRSLPHQLNDAIFQMKALKYARTQSICYIAKNAGNDRVSVA